MEWLARALGARWCLERTRRLLLEKMMSGGSMLRPIDREPAIGLPCHSGGLSPHAKAGMVAPAVCTIFQPGRLAFLEAPVRGLFSTAGLDCVSCPRCLNHLERRDENRARDGKPRLTKSALARRQRGLGTD